MATFEERINITLDDAKNFLRIDSAEEDGTVQMILDAAIEKAEGYLNNDFKTLVSTDYLTGEKTYTEDPIPSTVKLGVLQAVADWYENRGDIGTLPEAAQNTLSLYRRLPGL